MRCNFPPHMTPGETALLQRYAPQNGNILEFGCGGSTQLFFENAAAHLWSVDSDAKWIENILANPEIRIFYTHGRWTPIHADIGSTKEWGVPISAMPETCWLNYHLHCWDAISEAPLDLALIDGRFRVACLCQLLLRYASKPPVIVFHDFWNRAYYHAALEFLSVIDKVDSMGVFTPHSDLDLARVETVLREYQYNFY